MPNQAKPAPRMRLHPAGGGAPLELSSRSTTDFTVLNGWEGFGIPPVEHKTSERVDGPGSTVRTTRFKEREIHLPLMIFGNSQVECLRKWDALVATVSPLSTTAGTTHAKLEVTRPGKPTRYIDVLYKGGLEGTFGSNFNGWWMKVGLTLLAPNPFFWEQDTSISWNVRGAYKPFISGGEQAKTHKFFPIMLAPSVVQGEREIAITGDYEAAPVWRITGPVTDVKVTHAETGASFVVTGTLKPGETITVDTRIYDIYSDSARNGELWDRLTDTSQLFRLPPGRSKLLVTGTGMDDRSEIALIYRPQYLTGI